MAICCCGSSPIDSLFEHPGAGSMRRLKDSSCKDLCAVLKKTVALVESRDFEEAAKTERYRCALASVCDAFLKLAGRRVDASVAQKSGIPLHDDGCPIRGHVDSRGEKYYTEEDLLAAKSHYAGEDPAGGDVFTKEEAEMFLKDLTDGMADFGIVQVSPFVTLGAVPEHRYPLYRARDIWNSLRAQRPNILTMNVVKTNMDRGGHHGWAQ